MKAIGMLYTKRTSHTHNRGIALLLVLIALCVGTILTAGYLSSQSTSIGIAKNERDQSRCRAIAESGCELCMSLVKNRSNWRETMSPGTWISNYPLGGGTVTVTASDGGGASSFTSDVTQSVTFTATATYNGRSYTLSSSMTPTGGGTPFSGGVFCSAPLSLMGTSVIDSYDSSVGAYGMSKGSNAVCWSNATGQPALLLNGLVSYKGALKLSPFENLLGSISWSNGALTIPNSISQVLEPRVAGKVIFPNLNGLTDMGASLTLSTSFTLTSSKVIYNNLSMTGTASSPTSLTLSAPGTYYFRGALNMDTYSNIVVNASSVVIVLDGSAAVAGKILTNTGCSVQVYFAQNVDVTGTVGNALRTGDVQFLGSNNGGIFKLRSTGTFNGLVMAPTTSVLFQDSSKFYGSIVANDITLRDSAQLHQDLKLQSTAIHNVTGGSYQGDYKIIWSQ